MNKELRSGYTTGACAAAAAKGAALMLAAQETVADVSIDLPAGTAAVFPLHGQTYSPGEACCYVIKDAGDDPDVTNGAHIWATVTPNHEGQAAQVAIRGGVGIGMVTKPGLAVPPGEWAINPVPRRMIETAVMQALSAHHSSHPENTAAVTVTISIPDGEERARRTLNARLGILGGLSILGTTGIVRPISAKAWTDTIDAALDVAKACGCTTVMLSTGRTSEMAAQTFFSSGPHGATGATAPSPLPLSSGQIPEEACIMMGDHVAYALRACVTRGFTEPVIACQFAKLLKIACGHENTHAAASELDLAALLEWARLAEVSQEQLAIIANANTAREIAVATGFDRDLMALVAERAARAARIHAPGISVRIMLCSYDGAIITELTTKQGVCTQ